MRRCALVLVLGDYWGRSKNTLTREKILMKVFISHIHEEAGIAIVLKDWIESTFAGQCDVFVSSDSDNISAGKKWLEEIDNALEKAKVFIIICSLQSIHRPWTNFEAGCAWIKRIPIIPVCHSGLNKSNLLQPLSRFQALDIDESGFPKLLFSSLAKALGFTKLPRISYEEMREELMSAILSIHNTHGQENQRLGEIEEAILLQIAKAKKGLTDHVLASNSNMSVESIQNHIIKLMNANYLHASYYTMGPTRYDLNEKSYSYLAKKKLFEFSS